MRERLAAVDTPNAPEDYDRGRGDAGKAGKAEGARARRSETVDVGKVRVLCVCVSLRAARA